MRLTFTKQSDGRFAIAFDSAALDLIGIDPTQPVDVTTDGARLVIQRFSAADPNSTAAVPTTITQSYTPGMSCLDACHKYLTEVGGSHHAHDIAAAIIKLGYWNTKGATPDATAAALMSTEINRKPKTSRFIKTGPNVFAAR